MVLFADGLIIRQVSRMRSTMRDTIKQMIGAMMNNTSVITKMELYCFHKISRTIFALKMNFKLIKPTQVKK